MFKSDGIRGLYSGFGVAFISIFIYRGLYFGIYDYGKKSILNPGKIPIKYRLLYPRQTCLCSSICHHSRTNLVPWRHYQAETLHASLQAYQRIQWNGWLLQESLLQRWNPRTMEGIIFQHSQRNWLISVPYPLRLNQINGRTKGLMTFLTVMITVTKFNNHHYLFTLNAIIHQQIMQLGYNIGSHRF